MAVAIFLSFGFPIISLIVISTPFHSLLMLNGSCCTCMLAPLRSVKSSSGLEVRLDLSLQKAKALEATGKCAIVGLVHHAFCLEK